MYRLIYRSAALIPVDGDRDIFDHSHVRNRLSNITGVLIRHKDEYLQVLEGEGQTVSDLFNVILQDPRHTDVRILKAGAVDERRFGGWWMASASLDEDAWETCMDAFEKPERSEVDDIIVEFVLK